MTAFLEKGGMEAKYPRLKSEKIMTAYLGYEVDVLKKKQEKTHDYCRVLTGFRLIPKGKLKKRKNRGWPEKIPGFEKTPD